MGEILISKAPKEYQKYLLIGDKDPKLGDGDGKLDKSEAKIAAEAFCKDNLPSDYDKFLAYLDKAGYKPYQLSIHCEQVTLEKIAGLPSICTQEDGQPLLIKKGIQQYKIDIDKYNEDSLLTSNFIEIEKSIIQDAEMLMDKSYTKECGFHIEYYNLLKKILQVDRARITDVSDAKFLTMTQAMRMKIAPIMLNYHMEYGVGQASDFSQYIKAAVEDVDWPNLELGGEYFQSAKAKDFLHAEMISAYLRLKHGYEMTDKNKLFELLKIQHDIITKYEFSGWRKTGANSMKAYIAFQIINMIKTSEPKDSLNPEFLEKYKDIITYYSKGVVPVIITKDMTTQKRREAEKINTKYVLSACEMIYDYGEDVYPWIKIERQNVRARTNSQNLILSGSKLNPSQVPIVIKELLDATATIPNIELVKTLKYETLYDDLLANKDIFIKKFNEDLTARQVSLDSEYKYYNLYFNMVQIYIILDKANMKPKIITWIKKNIIDLFGKFYNPKVTQQ